MAGMETQVATAILLGGFYYLLKENWTLLGICCGLATIARPEFFAFVALIGLWLLIFNRRVIFKVVATASLITIPWYLFAYLYFGSIIPNTVHAKTWGGKIGLFSASKERILDYFYKSWSHIAPFREWSFVRDTPLPDSLLQIVVFLLLSVFSIGVVTAVRKKDHKLIVIIATILIFIFYRSAAVINPYFMWYLPPFMALLFIVAAYGMNSISKYSHRAALILSMLIITAYGIHIPYSFPIEKKVQDEIEYAVRSEVGKSLQNIMKETDSVFLEPLGYIGIEIRGKTTYDFPGLSSPKVIDVIRNLPQVRMGGVIEVLQPEFLVLRPREIKEFNEYYNETAARYTVIKTIQAKRGLDWSVDGYRIKTPDDRIFSILKRNDIN
jgi:hypothetical protein